MSSKFYSKKVMCSLKNAALSLVLLASLSSLAQAEILHPVGTSPKWESPDSWANANGDLVGRVPGASDEIVIPSGISLHVNVKPQNKTGIDGLHTLVRLVTIQAGGNLNIDGNAALVFDGCAVIDLVAPTSSFTFENAKKSYLAINGEKVLPENSPNQTGILKITNTKSCAPPTTLPVKFSQPLTAKQVGYNVILNWATGTETGTTAFDIQRSSDGGIHWQTLGQVAATNSPEGQHYTFTDAKVSANSLLYRLKVTDAENQTSFTKAVSLLFTTEVKLFPNPAHAMVRLSFSSALAAPATGLLINAAGTTVKRFQVNAGATQFNLTLLGLPAGLYFVQVKTAAELALFSKLIIK